MIAAELLRITLIWISIVVTLILVTAWRELGHPRHAFTWSMAFGLAAVIFVLNLGGHLGWLDGERVGVAICGLEGVAAAINTIGFRQRAGIDRGNGLLLVAAGSQAALTVVLALAGMPHPIRLIPLALLNAVLLLMAAGTLTGRRQGERSAERVAQAGLLLLALLDLAVLGGAIAVVAGLMTFDLAVIGSLALLLLPGIIAAIGLFTIILLTADLADRTRRLAATDLLTGLLNRRGFEDAARALLGSLRRSKRRIALVLIDVDRFKQVNDRFGHPAGDRVLKAVCDALHEEIGRRDILARIGGEEFALILTNVDLTAAACAAEVLRQKAAGLVVGDPPIRITASFGVAAPLPGDYDLGSMLVRADRALYRSKALGRDRVTIDDCDAPPAGVDI